MSLTHPAWLLLLPFAGIILALHTRRERPRIVSSVMLWRAQAEASTASRPRWTWPKPNPLLFLQLAAFVLTVLALAGPHWGPSNVQGHRVFVADGSGSMLAGEGEGSPTRFDDARTEIEQEIRRLRPDQSASLVLAASPPVVLAAGIDDRAVLLRLLRESVPTHGTIDWPTVASVVDALVQPRGDADVLILTDDAGKQAALRATTDVGLDPITAVRAVGTEQPNVGFTGLDVRALPVTEGDAVQNVAFDGVVAWSGSDGWRGTIDVVDATTDVKLTTIDVAAARGSRVAFDGVVRLEGPTSLELRLPNDALRHDNVVSFIVREAPTVDVLLVHAAPDDSPWLRALNAVPGVSLSVSERLPADAESFDLVVVDGVEIERRPSTAVVWQGTRPPGMADGEPREVAGPLTWDDEHPLSRGVRWSDLDVASVRGLPRQSGASALVEAADDPLIQARLTTVGPEVLMAFDAAEDGWTDTVAFPAFVANLIHWIEPDAGVRVRTPCRVGHPCAVPASLASGTHRLVGPDRRSRLLATAPRSGIGAPDAPVALPAGATSQFVPEQAGMYTVRTSEGTVVRSIAVNALQPNETRFDEGLRESNDASPSEVVRTGRSLWPWFISAAIAVLCLEGFLARQARASIGSSRFGTALRSVSLGLFFAALFGVPLPTLTMNEPFVLVLEEGAGEGGSESVPSAATASLLDSTGSPSRVGVVALNDGFSSSSEVAASSEGGPTYEVRGRDLALGLELAAAALASRPDGHIVLASSGMETHDAWPRVLDRLTSAGTRVDVLPVNRIPPGETLVEHMKVPDRLYTGVPFTIEAAIHSERVATARVEFFRDGEAWLQERVSLETGLNRITVTAREEEPTTVLYEMDVTNPTDVIGTNNHGGVVAAVTQSPRVAIIGPERGWALLLKHALGVQGVSADLLNATTAPRALGDWLSYDVVVLQNLRAIDLHTEQQEQLETWVRAHGGGLLMLGGANAFGPGGYFNTPLEDISPLSSRIPRERPDVAVVFVLDRSGSMQQQVGEGVMRLDVAREATWQAVQLMDEESQVGIVVFDSTSTLIHPIQPIDDLASVRTSLDLLTAGGGTSLYPALVQAYEQLAEHEAAQRHIIVMTDGLSYAGDFAGIMDRISGEGISLSAVSVGRGVAQDRLEGLAEVGGGTYYDTTDVRALPSIMTQEVLLLTSDAVDESRFVPQWENRDVSFVAGWPDTLPGIDGIVKTTPKPGADIHLRATQELPLLASWRYGLGRVIAYASHGVGAWDIDWFELPEFPSMWTQAVRWLEAGTTKPGLNVELRQQTDRIVVEVHALERAGTPYVGLEPLVDVDGPEQESLATLHPAEVEPGLYRAEFRPDQPGLYTFEISATTVVGRPDIAGVTRRSYVAYDASERVTLQDPANLAEIALRTGGAVLTDDVIDIDGGGPSLRFVPGWRVFALVALVVMILGLLARQERPLRRLSRRGSGMA